MARACHWRAGFHGLHCLNLLRKASKFNFDYYNDLGKGEFSDSESMLKLHINHCLDTIRLQLMCTADVTVVPSIWIASRPWMKHDDATPQRVPNFRNQHKCRDFDAIKDWYWEHQDPRPWSHRWEPQPDEDVIPGEEYH